jgi:hypothetical protein
VTKTDSCIKGALLVICNSMVLNEQADKNYIPILCCRLQSRFAVPAQKILRRAINDNQRDAASKT